MKNNNPNTNKDITIAVMALPPLVLRLLDTIGTHANLIFSPFYISLYFFLFSIYIYIPIYLNIMIIKKLYRKSGKPLNLTIKIYILIYINK